MTLLIWLIFAHLLAAFYLQPTASLLARTRHASAVPWRARLRHTLLQALLSGLVLLFAMALDQLTRLGPALLAWGLLVVSYLLVDSIQGSLRPSASRFLAAQLMHLLAIVAVWAWLTGFAPFVAAWGHSLLMQRSFWLVVIIYLLAARPTSLFVALVLQKQAQALAQKDGNQGLIEAGRLIGYVERWLIISFVVTGQFIGVGFLLAAKSIFRFGDLSQAHERRLTEYMLLGTLVSFASAMALGGLALYLLR